MSGPPPGFEFLDIVVQLGTSGGFGGLVYWLVCKAMPAMQDKFILECREQRTAFKESMDTQQEQCSKEMESIRKAYEHHIDLLVKRT